MFLYRLNIGDSYENQGRKKKRKTSAAYTHLNKLGMTISGTDDSADRN